MKFLLLFLLCIQFAHAQEILVKQGSKCPTGYYNGKGAYCYKYAPTKTPVIAKQGTKCPAGYYNGRGAYCYKYGKSS